MYFASLLKRRTDAGSLRTAANTSGLTVRNLVAKQIDNGELLRQESLRTRQGGEIGNRTGLFHAPRVIADSDGILATSWIPGIRPLRNALHEAATSEGLRLVSLVGRSLAAIHTHLPPSGRTDAVGWRGTFTAPDVVGIHGDFGMTNVQVNGDGEIVILDWAPPVWAGGLSARASSHWDLALFLVDMNYQRPRDPARVPGVGALGARFLAAYAEARPEADGRSFRSSLALMTANYYKYAGSGLRRLARLPSSGRLLVAPPRIQATRH